MIVCCRVIFSAKFPILGNLCWRKQTRNRDVSHALSSPESSPTTFLSGKHAHRSGSARHCTRLESRRGDDDDRRRRREIMSHSGAGSALSHVWFSIAPAKLSRGWNYRRRLASAVYGGQEIKCCPVTLFPTKKRDRMAMVGRDRTAW